MFINDEPNQPARQRHAKGYSQIQTLGHPSHVTQGQQMQDPQGHQMQDRQAQGHPEYPNHPNYSAMDDAVEHDNYDPDTPDDDELYDTDQDTTKSTWEKIKDFFKSTPGIVTLVVTLALIVALIVWYFNRNKGYKFLYY